MHNKQQSCNSLFGRISSVAKVVLALTIVFAPAAALTQSAHAQTFKVIYNFTGGADGGYPCAGLTMDAAGNFYGTTSGFRWCDEGASSGGSVFKLSQKSGAWVLTPLYTFRGGEDGADPMARVAIGPDGSLYGTTFSEGGNGCGIVFKLSSPAQVAPNVTGGWTETVVHRFTGGADGCGPSGDLVFDQAGNLFGTTVYGGSPGLGTVFELMPSGGGWTETVIYSFNGEDGQQPWYSGVILDKAGNLYGTTVYGGSGGCDFGPCGDVFQLTPAGSGWTESVIHNFQGGSDGAQPVGGLLADQQGTLYGAAAGHGTGGGGTVFTLKRQYDGWMFTVLYSFAGREFEGPYAPLVLDAAGNLYGTTYADDNYGCFGQGCGTVFKLYHNSWTYTSFHDFTGGSDGANPISNVVLHPNGNFYGTASRGGANGQGVIWEVTP